MRVLSMFDGISCGRVALERVGITPEVYYASEIDKYAEQVSADNYPDIIRLGDAYKIDEWELGRIDLLLGGSPCTHWSISKRNRETESSGLGWELFSLYARALEKFKPQYFLYENVRSMSDAIRGEITKALGVEPIKIDSATVSAQKRERLYWTNIPGIEQPEDKGFLLRDIIQPREEKERYRYTDRAKKITGKNAIYKLQKSLTRLDEKSKCLTCGQKATNAGATTIQYPDGEMYIISPIECERLQTLPDNYTRAVCDTQRYKTIGNGWTVDVIAHILGHINRPKGERHTMKSIILTAQDARDLETAGGLTITKPIKNAPPYTEGTHFRLEPDGEKSVLVRENDIPASLRYFGGPNVCEGDVVFIREPWYRLKNPGGGESDRVILAGDSSVGANKVAYKWASPVSMPEAVARRFARVVSVAPLYNEAVAVWQITLEKITKEAALAAEADKTPIASEADNPENASNYLTYAGDMSPEDYERMVAEINANRGRLAEIRERLAHIDKRLKELSRLMFEERDKVDPNDRDALEEENKDLQDEQKQLADEEAELVEALADAGVPVDEPGEPEETGDTEGNVESGEAAESGGGEAEEDEEIGSFLFGKCKYCGREWGVTLEGAKGGGYPTQRTANAAATRLCNCPEAVEKQKPIVGVAIAVTRGVCGFCGQYIEVGPHPSQAEADKTASEVCSCFEAKRTRWINEQIEDAREKIARIFGEEAESLGFKPIDGRGPIELLEQIVGLIAHGEITSAAVNIRGQCKAKLSLTSKEKIKVSRSETRSYALEAGK